MRSLFLLSTLVVSGFAADPYDQSKVPLESDASDPSLTKIVLVAGTPSSKPGGHEYFAGCALFMDWLKQTPGVFPVMARDGWPKNEGIFDNARSVVFYMDGGAKIPFLDERRWELVRELEKRGVGLVFLHQMIEFPQERREEAKRWLGGVFATGAGGRGHWESTFDQFPDHPATRGVKPFTINDGWLYGMDWVEAGDRLTHVLTIVPPDSSRSSDASRRRSGQRETIGWTFERENGGRSFSFSAADAHASWAEESLRRAVINGILWTARHDVPKDGASVLLAEGALEQNLDDKRKTQTTGKPARNPKVNYVAPRSLPGIGMDDIEGRIKGEWSGSSAVGPTIIGVNYLHDGGKNKGEASICFVPDVKVAGEYEVLLFAPPQGNRSKAVPVEITIADRPPIIVTIDQTRADLAGVHSLGRFQLPAGKGTQVLISNADTSGVVVVDGLQLRP